MVALPGMGKHLRCDVRSKHLGLPLHLWIHNREEQGPDLLGTLLMALSGRRTRTVRTAEKLTFCRSREYSSILRKTQNHRGMSWIQWRNVRLSNIIKQTLNAKHSQRNLLLHLSHQQSLPEELIKACLCVRIKSMRGECDTPAHRSLSCFG